jgi:hypothetical protein
LSFKRVWSAVRQLDVQTWSACILVAVSMLYALRAAWFFHEVDAAVHFDEGYIAAFGERLIDGRFLPYVDAVSQRGPVLYWLAGVVQAVFGRFEWTGIRHLVFTCFVVSSLGVFVAGWAARRPLTGAIGSLLFVTIMVGVLEEETVFGLLGEPVAIPFAVLSTAAVGYAMERASSNRSRWIWLAVGGALSAIAGLTKQTYLPTIVPFVLWTVLDGLGSPPGRRLKSGLATSGALLAGWTIPIAGVGLTYAIAGELHDFWYWFYRFNREVYMAPYDRAHAVRAFNEWLRKDAFLVAGLVMLVVHTLARAVSNAEGATGSLSRRLAMSAFPLVIAAELVIAVGGSLAPLRFWSQYYLPPVPWAALLLGWTLEGAATSRMRGTKSTWGVVTAVALLTAISVGFLESELHNWRRLEGRGRWASAYPEPVCESLDRYTEKGDPIFIWGFDSDLYITCRRRPASKYLYSTMIAGVVVPFWRDPRPEWVAENAHETLIAELTDQNVAVVIDSPDRAHGSSMREVKKLQALLNERYRRSGKLVAKDGRKMTLWVRKDLPE